MSTAEIAEPTAVPKKIRIAKTAGWIAAFFALLALFTVSKLPDDRIGGLILEKASETLSSGATRFRFSADRTRISLLLLGRIRFEGLTLGVFRENEPPQSIRWEEARISPSLLDLLLGRIGATVKILPKEGDWQKVSFWFRRSGEFSVSARLDDGDLGVAAQVSSLQATLPLTGSIELAGNPSNPSSLSGAIRLALGKTRIPEQKISGFPIPAIQFDDGEIRATIDAGKARIETLRLGKAERASDDIRGTASGEITLGRSIDESQLKLNANVKFSESVLKSLFLLEGLLGPGKQPDGSFSLQLTGSLAYPQMQPGGASP